MSKNKFDRPGLDDPCWDYVLRTRLQPYIEPVRKFWKNVQDICVSNTGVYRLEGPPGLSYRFTRTAIRSPIKGIQVFPFVPTAYLQIYGVQGGSTKMINRLCTDGAYIIDEFTVVEKSKLPSTFQQGQFLAFVPTELLKDASNLGKWIYLTNDELVSIAEGNVPAKVKNKVVLKL